VTSTVPATRQGGKGSRRLAAVAGGGAALAFGVALMASGICAATVGTHAGQVVMAGFTRWHVPLAARRAVTALPALVILALPVSTGQVLVCSQVVLSFGIPFALVPLLLITRDRAVMGDMVNRRATSAAMVVVPVAITALNAVLWPSSPACDRRGSPCRCLPAEAGGGHRRLSVLPARPGVPARAGGQNGLSLLSGGVYGPAAGQAGPWKARGCLVKVLVAGASGFVGRRLCVALDGAGHDVAAMTRNPARYRGAGTPVRGDVHDPATLAAALEGCQAAYYLVHSLQDADFERKDAAGATTFGQAAAQAGLSRLIYLGGLGDEADNLSAHLRSRRQVEGLLAAAGVPVTVVRAGIIIGHGGISWELTRQLVEHLRVMITPRWVSTRTQPIAIDDVITYLVGVLEPAAASGQVYEAGGPDVLQYSTMLRRAAAIGRRPLLLLPVPLLTPWLSSLWLTLVTDIDTGTGRALVDSMTNEVVVRDQSLRDLVPIQPKSYDDAVRTALRERREARQAGR
jgi:uncharacterized protein YbjT (DUF2867 family)